MRTVAFLAEEAIRVQDASNLVGISHRFGSVPMQLRSALQSRGEPCDTDAVAAHPVIRLWVSKLVQLSGCHGLVEMEAYEACQRLMEAGSEPQAMPAPVVAKHYYDDEGNLQFTQNRELLVKLAEVLMPLKPDQFERDRLLTFEQVHAILIDYRIARDLGGLGGGQDLERWRQSRPPDSLLAVLKEMFIDFLDRGFIAEEFKMAAHGAICEIQFAHLIPDEEEED